MNELLERAVPAYTGPHGNWDLVLRDAGVVRRRRRHVRRLVIALAAVAAVAIVWPSPPTTIERALAAAGTGQVLHLVIETDMPKTLVDLESGERREVRGRREVWFDPSAGWRERETFEGVLQWDVSIAAAGIHPHAREVYGSLGSGYADALRSGRAKVVREEADVVWIRIAPAHDVAVSRKTYAPVAMRVGDSGPTRILTYETLPAGSVPLGSGSGGAPQQGPVGSGGEDGKARLARGDVWAGEQLDGLRLASVGRRELPGTSTPAKVLFYGARDGAHVEITQAAKPVEGLTMMVGLRGYAPPEGTLVVEGPSGLLRAHGRYVTIVAGDAESTLAVARALRPY
jgi:hypothetical protein